MNKRSEAVVLAERKVTEARTAALAEYQAARAKLCRRMGSPLFIGGVILGAIALGYLAIGHRRPPVSPRNPGAWSRLANTVQVLLPLAVALHSAIKPERPRTNAGGTVR